MPAIKQYVVFRQVSGKESNDDLSAVEKAEKLVEAGAVQAKDNSGSIFFSGIVDAEMKKKTKYNVKLRLKMNGEVENSECDCPAGEGPTATCKHVTASLITISKFATTDVPLLLSGSCTDTLQTFKRPTKAHQGLPVPAEQLGKGVKDDDDPRPKKFRNRPSFMDELRMKTVNFVYHSDIDTSWRYTFPKANMKLAMRDHYYLDSPFCYY